MKIEEELERRIFEFRTLVNDPHAIQMDLIVGLAETVVGALKSGKKIAFIGNGGSAAEAMHLAAEFTGKCVLDHEPWPVLCFNESQSALTAIANDYGFEFVFSRMVDAHLVKGDLLIALSTSGESKNVVSALELATTKGCEVYLWSGANAPEYQKVKTFRVPSQHTPRIQEIHLVWGHLLAEIVELLMSEK